MVFTPPSIQESQLSYLFFQALLSTEPLSSGRPHFKNTMTQLLELAMPDEQAGKSEQEQEAQVMHSQIS